MVPFWEMLVDNKLKLWFSGNSIGKSVFRLLYCSRQTRSSENTWESSSHPVHSRLPEMKSSVVVPLAEISKRDITNSILSSLSPALAS